MTAKQVWLQALVRGMAYGLQDGYRPGFQDGYRPVTTQIGRVGQLFKALDANDDGVIDRDEFQAWAAAHTSAQPFAANSKYLDRIGSKINEIKTQNSQRRR